MGIIKSNKKVNKKVINNRETFDVTLSLTSEPNIRFNPKDIVLLLDRSGSMNGAPLTELKKGVNHFIDVINLSTGGVIGSNLGGGTKVGIVSFAQDATSDLALTNKVQDIKDATDAIVSSGSTNHADAFVKGMAMLENSTNDKIMVMFTDGQSNSGAEGYMLAEEAKAKGIEIYCVGFNGVTSTFDIEALKKWASAPVDDHVLVSPSYTDISQLFDTLGEKISEPKATSITLIDKINPCFKVVSINKPSIGDAIIVDKHTVRWTLPSLGAKNYVTEELKFTVQHEGVCKGVIEVDESYNYSDSEGNTINLPNPTIEILNTAVVVNEDCPVAHDITADGCDDYIVYNAGDIVLDNVGRIIEVSTTLKNICPNKRVALAVILREVDSQGKEHNRGMKTLLVPAHSNASCIDVEVNCVKFVVPEVLDEVGDPTSMCNARNFKAYFIANYIDTDYVCCGNI